MIAVQLVAPMPFEEAVQKFGERSPVASLLRSAEWCQVPVALRERAFFSATVESVRFLSRAQTTLHDFLTSARGVNERGESFLKTGGRAQFISELQKFAIREGMGPLDPQDKGTLKDITSASRLGLIFDTNVKAAQDFGYWKQGQGPDVLDAFPAQRFIRVRTVKKPRPYHRAHEGEVHRKDDLGFWLSMNPDFGVPWGPWGFNSGMDVEDVGRRDAEKEGVIRPDESIAPIDKSFNDNLQANMRKELQNPKIKNLLKLGFGDQAEFDGDIVKWKSEPPDEHGHPGNQQPNLRPGDRRDEASADQLRATALTTKAACQDVFAEWTASEDFRADPQAATDRAVEAQLASAAHGAKPLYFDPWGEDASAQLAERLASLPRGAQARVADGNLFVYRPEAVRPILDADPAFYRPNGEDDFEAIRRVTRSGENGELLGYGARSMNAAGGVVVDIMDSQSGALIYSFTSMPENAAAAASARARDISDYLRKPLYTVISKR